MLLEILSLVSLLILLMIFYKDHLDFCTNVMYLFGGGLSNDAIICPILDGHLGMSLSRMVR